MNVAPKALHIGGRMEATFFFRPLLKSTCPDAFRNDAFAFSTLYIYKKTHILLYMFLSGWITKIIKTCYTTHPT